MSTCTWKDCTSEAVHIQLRDNGSTWANLCEEHHNELDGAIKSLDVKRLVRDWILANGGAKEMAQKM